ncbi:MAG: acyltransferase family protein, partial [Bacteroidaceae bacterium]|nr:acyltransferase family protein [Bacteroidaceae bacterium]
VAYLLYSVITILFRKYYIHEDLTAVAWVRKILDFSAINYGWYIEMWIGLFLLTPFLNLLYKHIPDKRTKRVLIATLFLMTAVPSLTNRYEQHIFPDWWQTIWPLLFFFIGCYIREYRPIVSIAKGLAIIFGISLFNPFFNVLFVKNHSLIQITGGVDGAFGVIIAVIVFLLLYQRDVSNATTKKILVKVSFLSLDMYLLSYMFDMLVYPLLKDRYFVSQGQFGIWFFVAVPAVFLLSLAVSFLFSPIIKKLS